MSLPVLFSPTEFRGLQRFAFRRAQAEKKQNTKTNSYISKNGFTLRNKMNVCHLELKAFFSYFAMLSSNIKT